MSGCVAGYSTWISVPSARDASKGPLQMGLGRRGVSSTGDIGSNSVPLTLTRPVPLVLQWQRIGSTCISQLIIAAMK